MRHLHNPCGLERHSSATDQDHLEPASVEVSPLPHLRRGGYDAENRSDVPWRESEGGRRMWVRREDVGASAGGQSWGLCQPDEGVRPLGDLALPCSPPRSRSLRLAGRERGRSQGELDYCLRPTPTLRPHWPVSSSLDSMSIGEMTNEVGPTPGGTGRLEGSTATMTPRQSPFLSPSREKN